MTSSIMEEKYMAGSSKKQESSIIPFQDLEELQHMHDDLVQANIKLEAEVTKMNQRHALEMESLQETIGYLKKVNPGNTGGSDIEGFLLERQDLQLIEGEEKRKTLQSEVDRLKQEIACTDRTDHQEQIQKLKELLKSKDSEITESEEKRFILQWELNKLRREVLEMDRSLSCLVKSMDGPGHIEKMEVFLENKESVTREAEEKRRGLEEKLYELGQEHNNLQTEFSEMSTFHALELESLEKYIEYLKEGYNCAGSLERKELEIIEGKKKRKALQSQADTLKQEMSFKAKTGSEELQKLEALLKSKDCEITESEENRFILQWELNKLRREVMEMNQKMSIMIKPVDGVDCGETDKLRALLKSKELEVVEGEEKRKALHVELAKLRKDMSYMMKTGFKHIKEMEALLKSKESEIMESEEKRFVLQWELENLRMEAMEMNQKMSHVVRPVEGVDNQHTEQLEALLGFKNFEITEGEEKIRNLEEELEKVRQEMNETNDKMLCIVKPDLGGDSQQIEKLEELLEQLEALLGFKNFEITEGEEKIRNLEEELEKVRQEMKATNDNMPCIVKPDLGGDSQQIEKLEELLERKDFEIRDGEEKRKALQVEFDKLKQMSCMVKPVDGVDSQQIERLDALLISPSMSCEEKFDDAVRSKTWTRYLPSCSDSVDYTRDVSLTHSWVNCPPDDEDDELRKKNADRAAQWRTAYFTSRTNIRIHEYETDPSIHAYMKYRYRGSLVDFVCPTKTRDTQPETTEITKVTKVTEVTEVSDMMITDTDKARSKRRKRRFLGFFGH